MKFKEFKFSNLILGDTRNFNLNSTNLEVPSAKSFNFARKHTKKYSSQVSSTSNNLKSEKFEISEVKFKEESKELILINRYLKRAESSSSSDNEEACGDLEASVLREATSSDLTSTSSDLSSTSSAKTKRSSIYELRKSLPIRNYEDTYPSIKQEPKILNKNYKKRKANKTLEKNAKIPKIDSKSSNKTIKSSKKDATPQTNLKIKESPSMRKFFKINGHKTNLKLRNCKICGFQNVQIERHMAKFHHTLRFFCEVGKCEKDFGSIEECKEHALNAHGELNEEETKEVLNVLRMKAEWVKVKSAEIEVEK